MQKIVYLLSLFTVAGVASCGGKSAVAGYDNLGLTLQVDQTRGEVGRPVHITFTITKFKKGNYDIGVVESGSEPVMDIFVGYADTPYALWSEQQPPGAIPHRLDLKISESKTIQMTWVPDQRADDKPIHIQGILRRGGKMVQSADLLLPIGRSY